MRIRKLAMRGFRGATSTVEIPFDPEHAVTLLYGENGTGKSTIVDAFDFICNQNFGSLENYSLGAGETARKHITSLGSAPESLKLRLTADDGQYWTASLGRRGPLVDPEEGCPDAHILRRRDVTNVIEAPPSKRYEALKDYLTLPGIEKSEDTLRAAIRGLDRQYEADAQSLAQALDTLRQLWQAEGQPGASAQDWAMAQAGQDLTELQAALDEMTAIETAFRSAVEARELLDRALASFQASAEAHGNARQLQRQVSAQTQQAAELLELLRDAEAFVTAWRSIRTCPVCEQGIGSEPLQARLQQRIAHASELMTAIDTANAAETSLTRSSAVLDTARLTLCERARALLRRIRVSRLDQVLATPVQWDAYMTLAREGEATETAEAEARVALDTLAALHKALTARREAGQRSVAQHTAIRVSAERVDALQDRVEQQRLLLNRLRAIMATVSTARKRYAEDILDTVAEDVGQLYARIHPDEPLGRVHFALKRQASSSIELDAGFQDRDDLPPQAYYSESHLDTLGICVFLALARRFKTDRSIVILDDVVTSVDGPHVDRFMAMLQSQAQDFNQLIITTHEHTWAARYRGLSDIAVMELGGWSLERGVRIVQTNGADS
ncbi:MAG: AAA family ATPase [Chloroflexota bacterium]